MWRDTIVDEIHRVREEYAARFDFDLNAICDDLRRQQEISDREVVSFPPKPARPIKRIPRQPAEIQYPIAGQPTGVALRESNDDTAALDDESSAHNQEISN